MASVWKCLFLSSCSGIIGRTWGDGEIGINVSKGRFSMVARNAMTHKAYPVNPLVTSTIEENSLLRIGKGRSYLIHSTNDVLTTFSIALKNRKTYATQQSLMRVPPSSEEARVLHELYLGTLSQHRTSIEEANGVGKVKFVPIDETTVERTMLMFPQERK